MKNSNLLDRFGQLNLPFKKLIIRKRDGILFVWDEFRMKEIKLTPEEWVRQHFLHYLVDYYNYPKKLIAVEKSLKINSLLRRADAVIYGVSGNPKLIIECKSHLVPLSTDTLHQIAQYNFNLNVEYLILTNGITTMSAYLNKHTKRIDFLNEIPQYFELLD